MQQVLRGRAGANGLIERAAHPVAFLRFTDKHALHSIDPQFALFRGLPSGTAVALAESAVGKMPSTHQQREIATGLQHRACGGDRAAGRTMLFEEPCPS